MDDSKTTPRETSRQVLDYARRLLKFGGSPMTQRELLMDSAAFVVKRKLRQSWFARRLPERTRGARLRTLTQNEREIARARGWIR